MVLKQQKSLLDPVICRTPDAPLQDELLCWTYVVYGYFYWLRLLYANFCATLTLCITLNCALHYSNYVSSTFKVGQWEWPLLSGHMWYVANFELSGVYTSAHVRRTCTPYMCASVNTVLVLVLFWFKSIQPFMSYRGRYSGTLTSDPVTLTTSSFCLPSVVSICVSFGLNRVSRSRCMEFTNFYWGRCVTLTFDMTL